MSCVTWNGTIPWEAVPYDIEFDEFGVASSTMNVQFRFGDPVSAAAKVANLLVHPHFPWLKRSKAKVQREEADFAKASITFEGIPPNTDEKHYKLTASLSTEGIETHPLFPEWVEKGLAVVDDKNKLDYFTDLPDADDSLAGVESWLVPSLIYEETWVRGNAGSAKDFSKLGKKMTPPPSNAKPGNIGGGRDFLFLGGDIQLIGFGSKMTRRWRLSGPRGWNKKIYG